jgi:hypothetical protein
MNENETNIDYIGDQLDPDDLCDLLIEISKRLPIRNEIVDDKDKDTDAWSVRSFVTGLFDKVNTWFVSTPHRVSTLKTNSHKFVSEMNDIQNKNQGILFMGIVINSENHPHQLYKTVDGWSLSNIESTVRFKTLGELRETLIMKRGSVLGFDFILNGRGICYTGPYKLPVDTITIDEYKPNGILPELTTEQKPDVNVTEQNVAAIAKEVENYNFLFVRTTTVGSIIVKRRLLSKSAEQENVYTFRMQCYTEGLTRYIRTLPGNLVLEKHKFDQQLDGIQKKWECIYNIFNRKDESYLYSQSSEKKWAYLQNVYSKPDMELQYWIAGSQVTYAQFKQREEMISVYLLANLTNIVCLYLYKSHCVSTQ